MYPQYEVASFNSELLNTIYGYEQCNVDVAIRVSNILDLIHMRDSNNAICSLNIYSNIYLNIYYLNSDSDDHYNGSPMSLDPQWHVKEPWRR